MPTLPSKRYLRRGEIRAYFGIDDKILVKLIAAGALAPRYMLGKGKAFFEREQVLKAEADGKIFNTRRSP